MDIFKTLIKELSPLLAEIGFIKKGNNFYMVSDKNYGVVNFQKSRNSTKDVLVFTINFGVYSSVLGHLLYGYNDLINPDVEQCQWEARLGSFMPDSPDYWWNVNVSDNFNSVVSEVMEAIKSIIMPELNKRLSNEGLINSWLNDSYAGTTEIGRFKYLTTLLKVKEDFSTLNEVIERFMEQSKGKPNAIKAAEHLKEIEYK
jgi:Domain of unknown function (DUF4304)